MTVQQLLDLFAEALEIEPGSLTLDTKIADVDEWNSLGWLTIMSLVDERLNVELSAREIRGFTTARDVVEHLGGKTTIAG